MIEMDHIHSKPGDINAFGADPRRVAKAGHDVDGAEEIDFGTKYKNQNDAFKARFDSVGSKFNGKSLDDYINGKSFCCNGNSIDEIEKNNTQTAENAKLEDNLYFYHPDHLGSTSMVTNYDGEVSQNVAYIPYGEVFVEERNGSWATPFLFNAKELDEETGLYYYGARYLNPTDVRWLAVDPVFHPGASPYAYCLNNPIKLVDPDGRDAQVTGSGTEDDPYVVTAKYYYTKNGEHAISEETISGLQDALNQYNNDGKLWSYGKRGDKRYVKFDLQLEEVDANPNFKVTDNIFTSASGEEFSFGNFVSTKTSLLEDGTYAMGSANSNSININESRVGEEQLKGFSRSELIKSTFIHEIGHNLGLEEEVGGITIHPEIKNDKDFGIVKKLPNVTKRGVQEIMNRLDMRTHDQCKNDGVGVIRKKK